MATRRALLAAIITTQGYISYRIDYRSLVCNFAALASVWMFAHTVRIAVTYPDCSISRADTTQDAEVDGEDVRPFVDLLLEP